MNDSLIFNNTAHKILKFLSIFPLEGFYVTEIAKKVSLSKGAASLWLRKLCKKNMILAESRGKEVYYKINIFSPSIRQYKVLTNIVDLEPLIHRLKDSSRKIVLFGSSARGEDRLESDMDLFIVAKDPVSTQKIINNFKSIRKIQPIIKTAVQLTEFERSNKEFYSQITGGITLWEEKNDH